MTAGRWGRARSISPRSASGIAQLNGPSARSRPRRGADHYLQLGLHLRCPGRARPRARPARTLSRTGLGRPRMDPERQRSRVVARQSALPRRAGTQPLMEEPVMPASPLHRFFTELRRRRVIRVAIVYAVAGWVIVEVASTVLPPLDLQIGRA